MYVSTYVADVDSRRSRVGPSVRPGLFNLCNGCNGRGHSGERPILVVGKLSVDTQFGIILVNGIILVVGKFFWYFVSVVVDAR